MAAHTVVELLDDLDGTEADETVSFAVDGTSYEIDLNGQNAERLREALGEYIPHARKAGNRPLLPAVRVVPAVQTAPRFGPGPRTTATR